LLKMINMLILIIPIIVIAFVVGESPRPAFGA
jgi:hypothetical protein